MTIFELLLQPGTVAVAYHVALGHLGGDLRS